MQNQGQAVTLSAFAKQQLITEDRVWELIEEGKLAARFVDDQILVLRESDLKSQHYEPSVFSEEASIPEINLAVAIAAASHASTQLGAEFDKKMENDTDEELEIDDHLRHSEVNQDQRELLLFAQDAMSRNMELSRQLLATKDQLIQLKDEQIGQMKQKISEQEKELRAFRRQIENLETLCKVNATF